MIHLCQRDISSGYLLATSHWRRCKQARTPLKDRGWQFPCTGRRVFPMYCCVNSQKMLAYITVIYLFFYATCLLNHRLKRKNKEPQPSVRKNCLNSPIQITAITVVLCYCQPVFNTWYWQGIRKGKSFSGKEWEQTSDYHRQKQLFKRWPKGTCSELVIMFSCSHRTEGLNDIRAHIASQSPRREGKVVLHISIKQLVLTEQTIIQHSAQKSN